MKSEFLRPDTNHTPKRDKDRYDVSDNELITRASVCYFLWQIVEGLAYHFLSANLPMSLDVPESQSAAKESVCYAEHPSICSLTTVPEG